MKKNEVKVGAVYNAKVSDKLVQVRIDGESRHGGWDATNLATNKKVRIKSPQRLRGEVKTGGKKKSEARPEVNPTVEIITGQPVQAKREKKAKKPAADKPKRVSALDAAAQVLKAEGKPMRAKELIEAMAAKGLWSSPGGKTPEATLYAAMIREIGKAVETGTVSRVRKTDRGMFEYNDHHS
jgi:hypothetical protein